MLFFIFIIVVAIILVIMISSTLNKQVDIEIKESSIEVPSNLDKQLEKAIKKDKEYEKNKEKTEKTEIITDKSKDLEKSQYDKSKFQDKENTQVLYPLEQPLSTRVFKKI